MTSKEQLYQILLNHMPLLRHCSGEEYMSRCNQCGDTGDLSRGHLYFKIDFDSEEPIPFSCRRCGFGGYITNREILEKIIGESLSEEELEGLQFRKQVVTRVGNRNSFFPYRIPFSYKHPEQYDYLKERTGLEHIDEDVVQTIRYVPSIYDFLEVNQIPMESIEISQKQLSFIEHCSVSFLTNGNSHLMYRVLPQFYSGGSSWSSVPITKESKRNRVFYSLPFETNPYQYEPKSVYLSEGVFDCLGIYYRITNQKPGIYIGAKGNQYGEIIPYLISLGLFGSDVRLHLFSDNDKDYNKKEKRRVKTEKRDYEWKLGGYRYFFENEQIHLYYNQMGKDYGNPKEEIILKHYIL